MNYLQRISLSILLLASGSLQAANFCGDLKNGYGPFDYRKRAEFAREFETVEGAHFTEEVENGTKGSSGYIGGDLDYTLRAIPNHHRALAAMVRIALRQKTIMVSGAKYPVECYFNRAVRLAPDDGAVLAAYGNYLFALGKSDQAFPMFRDAAALEPEDPTIAYNLGLAYFRKKDYSQALVFAKQAYAKNFPLPGLKNKLIEAGKWDDKAE
jgi:hypothetical protein